MIHFALLLALSSQGVLLDQSTFPEAPDSAGWHVVAQRPEIAPRGWIDRTVGRGGQGALALAGDGKAAVSGGWEKKIGGIEAGAWYRLTVESRSSGIDFERQRVVARLDWQKGASERAGQPDYGVFRSAAGDWNKTVLEAPAPAGATQVQVQLLLSNAPQATVWWDHVRLEKIDAPKPRIVRVATVNYRARNTHSVADSVAKFIEVAKLNVKHSDLLVLPEAISISGNGLSYVDGAESIPGPSTEALGQLARALNSYVVAGCDLKHRLATLAKRCFKSHEAWRAGEPKPAGLERCDESRRARLCWTRALVEYRNRRAVQSAHSRHGNQAVAEVERVSWQDGC